MISSQIYISHKGLHQDVLEWCGPGRTILCTVRGMLCVTGRLTEEDDLLGMWEGWGVWHNNVLKEMHGGMQ